MTNNLAGGGQGPDTPTRADDRTPKTYSAGGSVQAPTEPDPWAILAGEAEADDVERVLAILDGFQPGGGR